LARKKWMPREKRMLADWLARNYPAERVQERVWLGPIVRGELMPGPGVTERVLLPFGGGWADALVLLPDRTLLIECKIRANPEAIGELQLYERLFRRTEEFRDRWDLPLELVLLYAYGRREVLELAKELGITLIEFRPSYIREYYRTLAGL